MAFTYLKFLQGLLQTSDTAVNLGFIEIFEKEHQPTILILDFIQIFGDLFQVTKIKVVILCE